MKIAFIYPPYHEIKNQPSIKQVARNYGVYPPINLAYVASVARNAGHKITIIDANAERLNKTNVLLKLRNFKPDIILFTITTYLFHQTLEWIRFLKKNLNAKTIVGGVHTSLFPKETLNHKEIDYAVIGDSENTLPNLLYSIENGKKLGNIKNICFRKNGKIILTKPGEHSNFLEGVYPARDLLPNEKYYEFISQRRNFTAVITSRGCPFRCTYCEQGSKNFFWQRNVKDVINEIAVCYDKYKVREIDFFDPTFTLDKKRTIKLCNAIKSLNLDLDYAVRTRVDCIDEEILKKLRQSGCRRIHYGIESSNKAILKRLNKNTDITTVRNAIKKTKKYGIGTFGFFMLGNDGDTLKTIRDTVKFSTSLGLDYAQYNKTIALAGTKMYEDIKKQIGYDFWAKYTLQKKEPNWIIPKLGTKLTDGQIDREIQRAYKKFYFRPAYILKRILRLKSYGEFKRYLKAGISFI